MLLLMEGRRLLRRVDIRTVYDGIAQLVCPLTGRPVHLQVRTLQNEMAVDKVQDIQER